MMTKIKFINIINNPDHGFLDSCNAGGPDEDPEEWLRRINKTVEEANKNPDKFSNKHPTNIPTHWRSSDPRFGHLVVKIFKVKGMMKLSTAFLKDLRPKL